MAFPTLEEWKTPWEEKGEGVDPDKVKAFVYAEKKRAHDAAEDLKAVKAEKKDLETKVTELESTIAKHERANESADEKAKREALEREESEAKTAEEVAKLRRELAQTKVQAETGLTEAQISRLKGETIEELLADAKVFMEEAGLEVVEETDAAGNVLKRVPATKGINLGDPNPNEPKELTADEIAAEIQKRRRSAF